MNNSRHKLREFHRTPTNPPQSQAIRANGQIFVSGQIPADASANLVKGNIGELTQACCDNIKAILDAAGSSVSKIVKVNVSHPKETKAAKRCRGANLSRSSSLTWPTSPR